VERHTLYDALRANESYSSTFNAGRFGHVGSLSIGTVTIPAFSAVGKFNSGQIAYPIPRFKGTFALNYERGPFNVRYQVRYIDSYIDQRTGLFNFNPIYVTPTNPTIPSFPVIGRLRMARTPILTIASDSNAAKPITGMMMLHEICKKGASVFINISDPRSMDKTPPIASKP